MWSSSYSFTTATPNMTQMTWHRVSPTVSRSLLWGADQNPEKSLAVLPAPHSSLAQVHKRVQICLHSPRTPLSPSVQTGPSRVSRWEWKLLVEVTPKCHEHSALSKNTSSVKVGALNKHQLGALTVLLQICRRKLSPTLNKVDSYKPKYPLSNWSKRPSCKEKICKDHFSSKSNEAFCFTNKFVNKLYKHRSCFPFVKFYSGNMDRTSSWGTIPLPALPEDLSCQSPQGLANAFLLYETFHWACSSNTGNIIFWV